MDKSKEFIYSKADFEEAIRQGLKDCFGYDLVEVLMEKAVAELKYANVFRFYDRNCPGCVGGKEECDFAYGKGEAKGCWDKAYKGELFNCPVRTNGTFTFNTAQREKGVQQVDLSDRDKSPYPVIKIKD